MKRIIAIVVIILTFVAGRKGVKLLRKYRHSKRLKLIVEGIKFPKLNLASLISDISTVVKLNISNFSPTTFKIQQLAIDVYSPDGDLLANPKQPLDRVVEIAPNQNNLFLIPYQISTQKLKKLISESGGVTKVGANYLTTGDYGITLILKGFAVAEGFKVEIDEKIIV